MSAKNFAFSIAKSPWSQAVAGGALALIPGRKYPTWLRQSITWGSTATVSAIILVPGLYSTVLERTSDEERPASVKLSPRARTGFALAAGGFMYGMLRLGWWFDEAAEQAMRTMRVPYPRVVLAIGAGALYYYTDDRQQKKTATQK